MLSNWYGWYYDRICCGAIWCVGVCTGRGQQIGIMLARLDLSNIDVAGTDAPPESQSGKIDSDVPPLESTDIASASS